MRAYKEILQSDQLLRVFAGALLGRLWFASAGLVILLLVRERTGSFGAGGLALAAFSVAAGVLAPARGRAIDRQGQTRMLLIFGLAHGAALGTLLLVAMADAPVAVLYVLCGAAGAVAPPLIASVRNVLAMAFDRTERRQAAYALDSIVQEISVVAGPLLAAGAVALASPQAALGGGTAAIVLGTALFATSAPSRSWQSEAADGRPRVALASPGLRTLTASGATFGFTIGAVDVAIVAFAAFEGAPAAAGILVALIGAGSVIGGLWYGLRNWHASAAQRYIGVQALLALAVVALAWASSLPVMGVLLIVMGLFLAPFNACLYALIDDLAPPGMATESFTWITTAEVTGAALGAAVAGTLAEGPGTREALLVAAVAALVGTVFAAARRGTLRGAPAPSVGTHDSSKRAELAG